MSDREKFGTEELVIVLSNFDLGVIQAIREYARGSRKAPKLRITAQKGEFLLKRRARGKDDPFKIAFSHALQLYLASKQFPLPHLIGTRTDNNSMLQHNGGVFELFEYIRGTPYDNSLEATFDSGKTLALLHKLLRDYAPQFEPPVGSYHQSRSVMAGFDQIPATFERLHIEGGPTESDVRVIIGSLRDSYVQAAEKVESAGLSDWPVQIVHCDWHPGNMLFRNRKVVAVIDYDAARMQQRVIDLANGVLQFSILGGTDDPSTWPDYLDESRFRRFVRGYDEVEVISVAELEAVPWLMVEAMVAESVLPIATTGHFGRIAGFPFLQMISRKIRWVQENAHQLISSASK